MQRGVNLLEITKITTNKKNRETQEWLHESNPTPKKKIILRNGVIELRITVSE